MKLKMKIIKYVMLSLFFTAVGATITILVKKYSNLTIDNELAIPDTLSFISTIILTLYIGLILDKRKNDDRIIKDTFIGYYKDYEVTLNERIRGLYNLDNASMSEITSVFKIIRSKLHHLNQFALEKNIVKNQSNLYYQIFEQVTELWSICTDGRDITITENKDLIENYLIKIEIMIYKLTFEINDL